VQTAATVASEAVPIPMSPARPLREPKNTEVVELAPPDVERDNVEPVKTEVAQVKGAPTVLGKLAAQGTVEACASDTCKGSGDLFGTAVTFQPSPKLAGEEAQKEHKLLFVLHVSGNFEDPGFT
jgi:hypothetical protein